MSRDRRHFDLALKIAATSGYPRAQHGAAIVRGSRVLALGVNSAKGHPQARRGTIHAELAAIIAAAGQVAGATLYSARMMRDGTPGPSRSCADCQALISRYGIRRIVYFDGQIITSEETPSSC